MLARALSVLAFALVAFACGGDDDGGDGSDAPSFDAAGSANHLGEPCSETMACPTTPLHQCVFLNAGNPNLGYCSPVCATDTDCTDGYTGPATGDVSCFVPDQPDACTIVCEAQADCPPDLVCVPTGGPVSVCTTE